MIAEIVEGAVVIAEMSPSEKRHLQALEKRIEKGVQTFRDVGNALNEIRQGRLYRETHTTFEAYIEARWGWERQRAYQLMGAAEVAERLEGEPLKNEFQARELVPLMRSDPEAVPEVWRQVREVAGSGPITAPLIREAVKRHAKNGDSGLPVMEDTPAARLTRKLVADLERATKTFGVWRAAQPGATDVKEVRAAMRALTKASAAS